MLWYYSKSGAYLWSMTESVEDAYDLAEGFLWDKFNFSKEEVVKMLDGNDFYKSDYVDIYNPEKIDCFEVGEKITEQSKYYFRITKNHTVTVTGTRN